MACKTAGFIVRPKPSYQSLGLRNCKDYADLAVQEPGASETTAIEIGLVHDGTQHKWRIKLDADAEKIGRFKNGLQIVIVASAKEQVVSSSRGRFWLNPSPHWGKVPDLQATVDLLPTGQMVISGWVWRQHES